MDKMLTNAFDCFSLEEVDRITPKDMTFELPADRLLRLQDSVLQKLRMEDRVTALPSVTKKRRPVKVLLIAAVVAALLAAGALAAHLSGSRFFARLFGSESCDIIGDYVLSDIAEVSDGTLRLTLESALSDGHYYYAVFSVERLDGGRVSGLLPDVDFTFTLEEPSRQKPAWQYEKLETPENSDRCIYCLAAIRSEIRLTALKMELKGMYSTEDGHRELQTEISVESGFLSCPTARGGESEGIFRNIELSPFSLWIDVYEAWEKSDAVNAEVPSHGIALKYRDGGTVGASAQQFADAEYLQSIGWDGMQRPNGTHRSMIFIRFSPFVDIGEVEAVVIDGVEYALRLELPSE